MRILFLVVGILILLSVPLLVMTGFAIQGVIALYIGLPMTLTAFFSRD
jgi:hypothetical protein